METRQNYTKRPQNGGRPISQGARIGHVHLKVANIERALGFYCGVLGFELIARLADEAAFISAGGYHHHIGLNTWESRGGSPPAPGTTGLYHLAILYPTRAELSDALRRVIDGGIQLDGASDHGVSEALYFARSRRKWSGALLGPPARQMAASAGWAIAYVHASARFGQFVSGRGCDESYRSLRDGTTLPRFPAMNCQATIA